MRNIVLLNLSDIHCLANSSEQQEIFDRFFSGLKEFVEKKSSWQPDFIIIPGDIIDGKGKDKKAAYQKAGKFIDKVLSYCGLDAASVITVPGNHDRVCPREDKPENRTLFRKTAFVFRRLHDPEYMGDEKAGGTLEIYRWLKEIKTQGVEKIFCDIQGPYFKDYNSFVSRFYQSETGTGDGVFFPVGCLKDSLCGLTMGYKVFDQLKIVFLLLNTEWLHFPSFARKVEPRIGQRFVKELVGNIRKEYPNYLVVTVMHRPPNQWEWEEKNVDRINLYNPYHMFLDISDLSISGHDHLISFRMEPEYLSNKVQHFQLGALACRPDKGDVFLNAASLLKIDAITNEVEMVYATLGLDGVSMNWNFDKCAERYPLRGRYGKVRYACPDGMPGNKFRINDVDIVWTKRNIKLGLIVKSADKEYVDQVKSMNKQCTIREILRYHYYGQAYKTLLGPDRFQVDGEVVCVWSLEEWKERRQNIVENETPMHYIVYASNIDDWRELQKEKQRFLLSSRILRNIFSIVIVQNN